MRNIQNQSFPTSIPQKLLLIFLYFQIFLLLFLLYNPSHLLSQLPLCFLKKHLLCCLP
uniref:Uncharacterized protein n=1 Tax=Siphoviridae sp. ctl0E3 TaxID=2827586 RepID=A0A8S5LPA9_9CAUD|nr:MAG TPA: hypothetical protein [Siphoviridae sp. ctl0E3]DAO25454.1 MAG TPA: hypothetical protein [Caudoviricetes sp.]DAR53851.1 MAG TPA: hypothetical protein [Caudoviricetes sp.]